MAYNITLLDNVSTTNDVLGFININAGGLFFVFLLVTLIFIIALQTIRNGVREFKALFFAFAITLVPVVIVASLSAFGVAFLPAWYLLLHLTLLAITGVFAYFNK